LSPICLNEDGKQKSISHVTSYWIVFLLKNISKSTTNGSKKDCEMF
jgi:hypothetical protein